MATLEEFKALRAGVAHEVQTELVRLMSSDPEAAKQCMVEIAAAQGVTLTSEEVHGFLLQMDEEEEFDDIELDPIALMAIAGGNKGEMRNCNKILGNSDVNSSKSRLREERREAAIKQVLGNYYKINSTIMTSQPGGEIQSDAW